VKCHACLLAVERNLLDPLIEKETRPRVGRVGCCLPLQQDRETAGLVAMILIGELATHPRRRWIERKLRDDSRRALDAEQAGCQLEPTPSVERRPHAR